jgi:hypothetical protein
VSDRTPATEKGTADRIEVDDGGYWVRLVTKQALKREGECMENCLRFDGECVELTGDEDLVSDSIWSLRKADGVSYMDVQVDTKGYPKRADIDEARGPKNSQPAGWSIRQLRHLVIAFRVAGAKLRIPETIALTGEDGRTWRPDKAPQDVKDAIEARKKAEVEARRKERADNPAPRYEILPGQVMIRPAGSSEPFVLAGSIGTLSFGLDTQGVRQGEVAAQQVRIDITERPDLPIIRSGIEVDDGPPPAFFQRGAPDDVVFFKPFPDGRWEVLRGEERAVAIMDAVRQGIITEYVGGQENTVTVSRSRSRDSFMLQNQDGTWRLRLGDLIFPKVMPTCDASLITRGEDTVTFRLPPPARARRFVHTQDGALVEVPNPWRETPPLG